MLAHALFGIDVRRLYLDDADRNPVDEQHQINPNDLAAGFGYGIFTRDLKCICAPVLPVDVLEWPLARGGSNALGNAKGKVIGHALVRAHDTLWNAIRQSAHRGIDIWLKERIGAIVKIDTVDAGKVGSRLRFEEGHATPSVSPLIGFRPRDVVPAAINQRVDVSISNYIANPGDGTNWLERLTSSLKSFKVTVNAPAFQTTTNCASSTGACESATAGAVAISPGTTSVTVSTTAINQRSEVRVDENFSYGSLLNVTCDVTLGRHYAVTNQLPAQSFDIITDAAPTNWGCLSYSITN